MMFCCLVYQRRFAIFFRYFDVINRIQRLRKWFAISFPLPISIFLLFFSPWFA
jgi:hypothetical protein